MKHYIELQKQQMAMTTISQLIPPGEPPFYKSATQIQMEHQQKAQEYAKFKIYSNTITFSTPIKSDD
jgi:hypothetical protein